MEKLSRKEEQILIEKTALGTIVVNLLLSVIKFFAGVFGQSAALLSDALHSAGDVISTVFVFFGARVSRKKADETHPYGHERFEALLALLMGLSLLGLALFMFGQTTYRLVQYWFNDLPLTRPNTIALVAVLISIIINELLFWWALTNGKKAHSSTLIADAWHHRFDAISSFGGLIGIGGALLGYLWLDPIAALFISLLIMRVALSILLKTVKQLVDASPDLDTMQAIESLIESIKGVKSVDDLKGRLHAEKMFIDVEIGVEATLNLKQAHTIAENVHHQVEANFPLVKHCMVHVNPNDN